MTLVLALLVAGAAMREARASSPTPLLPRLVADPPDGSTLTTSSVEGKTRLLLRFNGYLHNDGEGALDIRGKRDAPTVAGKNTPEVDEEVEAYKSREETLPSQLEEELATPKMEVSQRLFTTNAGTPANGTEYLERPSVEQASSAEEVYSNGDGHHHWHLQHIATYSLWDAAKDAEVAPSQKVGFCLDDSEHEEAGKGPATPVYASNVAPYTGYCRQWEPNATSLYEGISPGWRDKYRNGLAFQWVDVSDVAPGEYWLREDVDPKSLVTEEAGGSKTSYSSGEVTIPGFDAEGLDLALKKEEAGRVSLPVESYGETQDPVETIVSSPVHGTLGSIEAGAVTYTPAPGFSGSDSFSFTARDPASQFPESPTIGTVSITVASPKPTLAIDGARDRMIAGSSLPLATTVANDTGAVEWEASAGSLESSGANDRSTVYTAPATPPPGGVVRLLARLHDDPEVKDERTITIEAQPVDEPLPEVPPAPATKSPAPTPPTGTPAPPVTTKPGPAPHLSPPRVMLFGRSLVISTTPRLAGRVRLSAYLGARRLGTCVAQTPPGRSFTCVVKLKHGVSLQAAIKVQASLRIGSQLWEQTRPAAVVPEMKMRPIGKSSRASLASADQYWCSPSTLAPVLVTR